jgi:hypothetical protein
VVRSGCALFFLSVGASLLAMAARQPANLLQVYTEPCGSWPASDGGLTADQLFPDEPQSLVGVSLLAMAAWQPVNYSHINPNPLWE